MTKEYKIRENILNWLGHVIWRKDFEAVRLYEEMYDDGKRKRERSKRGVM